MAHSSSNKHPYPRSARVNKILTEIISEELMRMADVDDRLGLLTVTGVSTTEDVRQAIVFFDSLDYEAREALEDRRAQLQAAVNAQTRMKRTPKLQFMVDPAIASGIAVEEILRRKHNEQDAIEE